MQRWRTFGCALILSLAWVAVASAKPFIPSPVQVLEQLNPIDKSISKAGAEVDDSIARLENVLEYLIDRGDKAAKERLEQIRDIVHSTIVQLRAGVVEDAHLILDRLNRDLEVHEQALFARMDALVWKVGCEVRRHTLEDLPAILGDLGKVLGTHKIRITLPVEKGGLCFFGCDTRTFRIETPFPRTYAKVRDTMLGNLEQWLTDETPADAVVGTYEFLSELASKASCFVPNNSERLRREHLYFAAKAKMWNQLLDVEIR